MSGRAQLARWLACTACIACSAHRGPDFPTSKQFADLPRRAPSFAAEPGPAIAASDLSSTPGLERAVTPLDAEAARHVVTRFFAAVLLESGQDLFPLFATQAYALSDGGRQPAQAFWRARLAQLDYTSLTGRILAPPAALHTYTSRAAERAAADGVLVPTSPDEVVVVANLPLSWTGKTRLFGDQLVFRLRRKPDRPAYEIAEIAEDFRLP